jgi:protoheme IX farnesyltransferase
VPLGAGASAGDYLALLKPRVMSLVVFTGLVGLYLAPGALHPFLAFIAVLCIAVGAGASGAFPPMIGWAAVTGDVSLAPLVLFLLIFMWTPPHFWALALYRAGDYAKAGVPMLPVVAGERKTRRQILIYTILLAPVALAPAYIGLSGPVYGAAAAALSAGFLVHAWRVLVDKRDAAAKRMFGFSIAYLFGLFAMLVVDKAMGLGW